MAAPTSGQAAASQNGTAKTGRRRKVKTQAGSARYHKPIGSEIGGPRDANHAAIQQDQGARRNYGDLVNGDAAKQRQTLEGMGTEDLNKLADIAFSFKSSDPKVVALRIAARNAQAKRGIRVPVGQTQTKGGRAVTKSAAKSGGRTPVKKAAPRSTSRVRAMAGADPASRRLIELSNAKAEADKRAGRGTTSSGSFPVNSPKQVRDAQRAIGRAKPEQRPAIARHIIAKARELNCSHMISDATAHYARGARKPGSINMARTSSAVELAGKWKHGYIPLDATAMASKMKGGHGKPWWDGPGHSSGGSAKKALHGSPKSGSAGGSGKLTTVVKSRSDKPNPRGAKVDHSKMTDQQVRAAYLAAPKGSPEKTTHAAEQKRRFDARAKSDIAKSQERLQSLGIDAHGNKLPKSDAVRPRTEAHHAPGSAVAVQAPGTLGKSPGTVQGHDEHGGLIVKWADSSGKSHTSTFDPAEVHPRAVRTAKVEQGPSRPLQNRHSEPDKPPKTRAHATTKAADGGRTPSASSVSSALSKAGFQKQAARKGSGTNHRGQIVQSAGTPSGYKVRSGLRAGEVEIEHTGYPEDHDKMARHLESQGFKVESRGGFGGRGRSTATHVVTRGEGTPAKAPVADKPRVGTTSATDVNKVSSGSPTELAQKYIQMHGDAGARRKIGQLLIKKMPSSTDKALLAALQSQVGGRGKA